MCEKISSYIGGESGFHCPTVPRLPESVAGDGDTIGDSEKPDCPPLSPTVPDHLPIRLLAPSDDLFLFSEHSGGSNRLRYRNEKT